MGQISSEFGTAAWRRGYYRKLKLPLQWENSGEIWADGSQMTIRKTGLENNERKNDQNYVGWK